MVGAAVAISAVCIIALGPLEIEDGFARASNGHVQLTCNVTAIGPVADGEVFTTFSLVDVDQGNGQCQATWTQEVTWTELGLTPCWCVYTSPCPSNGNADIHYVSIVRGLSVTGHFIGLVIFTSIFIATVSSLAVVQTIYGCYHWRLRCEGGVYDKV
jgi:hypothetical protein